MLPVKSWPSAGSYSVVGLWVVSRCSAMADRRRRAIGNVDVAMRSESAEILGDRRLMLLNR